MIPENELNTILTDIQSHFEDSMSIDTEQAIHHFKNHRAFDEWSLDQTINNFIDEDEYVEEAA